MSEAKHTPGPWLVGPADDTVITHMGADGLRYEIAAVDGDYNEPDTWPVMEANARLIAAAPDLVKALRDILRIVDAMNMSVRLGKREIERVAAAWAALAKAGAR